MRITRLHISTERPKGRGHQFDEALIADCVGELPTQIAEDVGQIIGLAVAKAHLVEVDHNDDDFTHRYLPPMPTRSLAMRSQRLVPVGKKGLAKRIDMVKEFE